MIGKVPNQSENLPKIMKENLTERNRWVMFYHGYLVETYLGLKAVVASLLSSSRARWILIWEHLKRQPRGPNISVLGTKPS